MSELDDLSELDVLSVLGFSELTVLSEMDVVSELDVFSAVASRESSTGGEGTSRPNMYSSSKKDILGFTGGDGVSEGAALALVGPSLSSWTADIMKAVAWVVGGGFPRTKVDPPAGLLGPVAFVIPSVKCCFWLSMTLH